MDVGTGIAFGGLFCSIVGGVFASGFTIGRLWERSTTATENDRRMHSDIKDLLEAKGEVRGEFRGRMDSRHDG